MQNCSDGYANWSLINQSLKNWSHGLSPTDGVGGGYGRANQLLTHLCMKYQC